MYILLLTSLLLCLWEVMDIHVWPNTIQSLPWPRDGLTYSYEIRYFVPEKVGLWLSKAFGEGKAKYAVSRPCVVESAWCVRLL